MNVEYTGRHYVVTSTIRKEVETGLDKNPQNSGRPL